MDAYEATRVVFSRIQALDPDNAAKIMGLLLIQDHGEKEMIRLAFGSECALQSTILKSKKELGLLPPSPPTLLPRQLSSRFAPPPLTISSPSWAPPLEQDSADDCWGAPPLGWKPCLYYARGYCKNGSSCRFLHEEGAGFGSGLGSPGPNPVEEMQQLMRSKSQRMSGAAFPYSPTSPMPISPSSKCINFLLQQQSDNQRVAAAAAAAMMLGDDKFMGRSRLDRADFAGMVNPGSRQIYLTFPADSTFREEDVSNYFSIYGPVQDVRIPYQQKRMFGFVTFVYPETVKLILAKGNPHFVCDARVLVKPYKEKGKIPDKKPLNERGDFSGCNTPTGLDSRDPYDLQQLGARMLYNSSSPTQEMFLRRKLEEQQQAAELQQAIELQGRRFMGLQLMDFKSRSFSSSSSPHPIPINHPHDQSSPEDKSPSPASSAGDQQVNLVNTAVTAAAAADEDSFQESVEHNLPDSPFASPTKGSSFGRDFFAGPVDADLASPFKSCLFQMPRFSSGHGAVGL